MTVYTLLPSQTLHLSEGDSSKQGGSERGQVGEGPESDPRRCLPCLETFLVVTATEGVLLLSSE